MLRKVHVQDITPFTPGEALVPGVLVQHATKTYAYGLLISLNRETMSAYVLWTVQPGSGFENFAMPLVRKVNYQKIAQDLVSIQPMSLPSGTLFYLDYTYGSGSNSQS